MLEDWQLWEELHLSSVCFNQELCAEIASATFQGSPDVSRSAPGGRRFSDLHRSGSVSVHCRLLWLGHMPFTLCEQKNLPLGLSGWIIVKETVEVGAGYLWPLVPNSDINWLFLHNKGESRVYQKVKKYNRVSRNGGNARLPFLPGYRISWLFVFLAYSWGSQGLNGNIHLPQLQLCSAP